MRWVSITIIMLFGISLLWFASSAWGIGYDPDSIIYEDVAENWIAGQGIARFDFATGERYPMTNFPPLYPIVLGVISQVVGSVSASARILNTILWALLWLLVYGWIRRGQAHHWIAFGFSTLLMMNLMVLQVFGTSWSEPLFLVLGLSGLSLIVTYHQQAMRRALVVASLLLALAILTRYAGVALVLTVMINFLLSQRSRRERLRDIVILGIITGSPLLLWLLRNISVRGDVANRDVGFTWVGLPQLQTAIGTLGTWLIPIPDLTINLMTIGIVLVLLGWTWVTVRRAPATNDITLSLMGWWIWIYVLFIVASFSLLDPRIPFNYRILLPAYVGLIILVGRWITLHWDRLGRVLRRVWQILGLAILFMNILLAINWSVIIARQGQQYSHAQLQQSTILQDLRDASALDIQLLTNNNFLLHYQTGKAGILLPSPLDTDFEAWLAQLPDDRPIEIIFFGLISQRDWESREQLEAILPVTRLQESDVVTRYQLDLDS